MEFDNILVAIMAILISFAKGLGSSIWVCFARKSIEDLLKEYQSLRRKKIDEEAEKHPFLKKEMSRLSADERDLVEWIDSYVSSKSMTESIGVYRREEFWIIAFVFATLFLAVFLAKSWGAELSGQSYWQPAILFYIFIAALCFGAWDRCFQCALRTSEVWSRLDGEKIAAALERHGGIIKVDYDERQKTGTLHLARDNDAQIVLEVREIEAERAIDYIMYGSGGPEICKFRKCELADRVS